MANFFNEKLLAYKLAYKVRQFRNVSIYPKILEKKRTFSEEEKSRLSRKGMRWYVYYDYLNPETNKFERQKQITGKVNRLFPNFDDRLREIKLLKEMVIKVLEDGYSPYTQKEDQYTIINALEFALSLKEGKVSGRTFKGYEKSVNAFNAYLKKSGRSLVDITDCDKKIIVQFLDSLKGTNRTRNNYKTDLSAVFSVLVENDYIKTNPVQNVSNLPTAEKRDPTYSEAQVKRITDYLKKEDPVMLMYVYFVSYLFWRPKENCRLKVKDIDLEERKMTAFVKQGKLKTKLIPEILMEDLREYLKGANPEDYVFTPNGPGAWETQLDNRRNYFSQRYKKIKEKLKLDPQYTIYSFRHSFVTRAYRNILKEVKHEDKAVSILSKITGHTSKAVYEYIHYADVSLPEDYSKYLK